VTLVFDHIGVFVRDLASGREHFQRLLPIERVSDAVDDPLLRVSVQFLHDASGTCYELVAPYGEGNPVDAVLGAGKNILNHVAYKASDFDAAIAHFRGAGCMPLGPARPALAFGNARVIFFLTPLRMIVELVETA
jgi:methylmalonyl-CoA/ethylmalonyl-CoA epimerase